MSAKRKLPSLGLERRVRPRREEEWEAGSSDGSSEEGVSEEGITGNDSREDAGSRLEPDSDTDSEPAEPAPKASHKINLTSVSFGALARAQAALPPPDRKSKSAKSDSTTNDAPTKPSPSSRPKAAEPPPKRSSKHAPQEQTSKRPVSRLREILPDTRRQHRDPRFDPLAGPLDEAKARKAYAFLDEYREGEMAELRAQIKKTKDADAKEDLKRQLLSMESKKKARLKKDEEERVVLEHRRHEKELVAQGKTPFYLKRSEQKKRVLTDRFAGMSKGQVDRAIERKRKKVASKEKKELGALERVRSRR